MVSFIDNEIKDLRQYIDFMDIKSEKISVSNIGWHIYHSLLTIIWISDTLKVSKPENSKYSLNLRLNLIFGLPKTIRNSMVVLRPIIPPNYFEEKDLHSAYNRAIEAVIKIDKMERSVEIKHPDLGCLNRNQVKRYIRIHTNNHLKIIKEIMLTNNQ